MIIIGQKSKKVNAYFGFFQKNFLSDSISKTNAAYRMEELSQMGQANADHAPIWILETKKAHDLMLYLAEMVDLS